MVQNPIGHSSPPKSDKYHYPPRFFLRGLCIIHDISKLYEIIRLGSSQRRIGLKTGFVQKKDLRAQLFGALLEFRIGFLLPEGHRLRIPLIRAAERFLRGDV